MSGMTRAGAGVRHGHGLTVRLVVAAALLAPASPALAQREIRYDRQLLDKLHRADFGAIGTDESALLEVLIVMRTYNDADCSLLNEADRRPDATAEAVALATMMRQYYNDVLFTLEFGRGGHPLYLQTTALFVPDGCAGARPQTILKNLMNLIATRTARNEWDRQRRRSHPSGGGRPVPAVGAGVPRLAA